MKPINAKRERGAALLALLAVIMLGASWILVSQLNSESGGMAAVKRARNAEVLNQAKQALIGYVAMTAAQSIEKDPGRLPCPEAPGNFGSSANEGIAAGNCTLPAVGRLPWRTLGLDKLVDAAGEPLWYAVSPSWALLPPGTPATLTINSNTVGQLTVNGVNNDSVALIIAPGPAFAVPAATGCAAWNQVRPTTGVPDWRNYLECENATNPADSVFVTTGPSGSFNDQVIKITVADIMPAIEAAIAIRIDREIVPVLKTVYADATWGTSSSSPAFPFATTFGDPTTSSFQGQAGLYQGLLPFNYHSSSCPVGDNRCSSNAITWGTPSMRSSGGPGYLAGPPPVCAGYPSTTPPSSQCEGNYYAGALTISHIDPANSFTTGFRTASDFSGHTATAHAWRWVEGSPGYWVYLGLQSATVSRGLASSGAADFIVTVNLPSVTTWGYYRILANRVPDSVFADHAILISTAATTGWFVRNEWYRLLYYAIAPNHAPGGSLSCSSTGTITCLQVTNLTDPTKQRAVLALAGRSLSALSQTRPSATLQNYLDSAENRNGDSIFVQSPVNRSFNDRFISMSKNP